MTSLADYNNNPGNLRPPKGVEYDGQIGVDENGFAVFENKDYGRKALVNDIKAKINRGLNTPDKFVNVYAPEGDNDESARDNYKIHLADTLGLNGTGEEFPKDSIEKIADAITVREGGKREDDQSAQGPSSEDQEPSSSEGEQSSSADSQEISSQEIPQPDPAARKATEDKIAEVIGGSLGVMTGIASEKARVGYGAAKKIYDKYANKNPSAATVEAPTNLRDHVDSVVRENRAPIVEGSEPLGPVESTGTGTFNYGKKFGLTNTDAARAVDMTKGSGGVWDLSRKAAEADRKIQERFGGYGFEGVPERSDLLLPTVSRIEKGNVPPPVPGVTKVTPNILPPAEEPWLSKQASRVGNVFRNPWVSKPLGVGLSGLSGAIGAKDLNDAVNMWMEEGGGFPSEKTLEKGLSGLGGVIGTVPPGRGLGFLLQMPEMLESDKDPIKTHGYSPPFPQ